jgi:hypothetical protein
MTNVHLFETMWQIYALSYPNFAAKIDQLYFKIFYYFCADVYIII